MLLMLQPHANGRKYFLQVTEMAEKKRQRKYGKIKLL